MIKKLNVDFMHNDDRGTICQVLSIPNKQINYLYTKKSAKRGRHYHKQNKEIFYVISGEVELDAYEVNTENKEKYLFKAGDLFLVEPYTIHDFDFLEDTQMIVAYDLGIESSNGKDIYTE